MGYIVTFGEIMLRLKTPGYERFFQSPSFEATFGGGEANVATSLSLLGEHARFITALPKNSIGDAAIRELQKYGVDVSAIQRTDYGRVGIYFLETGANQRGSKVVYDREYSAISMAEKDQFHWESLCKEASWIHITGITPALSEQAAQASLSLASYAKEHNIRLSIDLNYRKKLWNYGKKASEIMRELTTYADVVMANEEDIQHCLAIESDVDVTKGELSEAMYEHLAHTVMQQFPNLSMVAITLRESMSADRNGWRAVLLGKEGYWQSQRYEIEDIVDRVGGGDSFCAALIYGLLHMNEQEALQFAVAASCLKHSILGDLNLITKEEIYTLMKGDGSGRVQR